jgi:uncharacterized protein
MADMGTSSSDGSDSTARVLGIVGIVIGALGVAFGVIATRRRPASDAPGSDSA